MPLYSSPPVPVKFHPSRAVGHPLGVKPRGNLFAAEFVEDELSLRKQSLGLFSLIDEEHIMNIFEFLDDPDLVVTESVSKYFLAFSRHNELWRSLFWKRHVEESIQFEIDWKTTFFKTFYSSHSSPQKRARTNNELSDSSICSRVYSDLLYASYRMSGLSPTRDWLSRENIDRIDFCDLKGSRNFVDQYEAPNKPVIITGFIESEWKVACDEWKDVSSLVNNLNNEVSWACGSVSMRLCEFENYLSSQIHKTDDNQYFVFDTKIWSSKQRLPAIDFFGSDLFDLLSPPWRPDNAWLLVGAPGAASKWHVDPNSTSAWNAVITGEKKWIMLPPHLGPPSGVEASTDGFAVRQPLTLLDWLTSGYYEEMYEKYHDKGLVECTCKAGEIVFVPRGWWHCVINTGDIPTIAVTQNYAAESGVDKIRNFLKKYKNCVSGIPHEYRSQLWMEFDRVLLEKRPDLILEPLENMTDSLSKQVQPIKESKYADSCDSGDEECGDIGNFSFWDNLGSKKLEFSRTSSSVE